MNGTTISSFNTVTLRERRVEIWICKHGLNATNTDTKQSDLLIWPKLEFADCKVRVLNIRWVDIFSSLPAKYSWRSADVHYLFGGQTLFTGRKPSWLLLKWAQSHWGKQKSIVGSWSWSCSGSLRRHRFYPAKDEAAWGLSWFNITSCLTHAQSRTVLLATHRDAKAEWTAINLVRRRENQLSLINCPNLLSFIYLLHYFYFFFGHFTTGLLNAKFVINPQLPSII